MFNKILAATDKVTVCDAGVLAAASLAEQNHSKLYILHVLESPSGQNRFLVKHYKTGKEILTDASYQNTVKGEMKNIYTEILTPFSNFDIRVTPGFPWEEIIRWGREVNTDLIAIGSHSTSAEEKGVVRVAGKIGSTLEGVIMREHCPVFIVNRSIPKKKLKFKRILAGIDFSKSCECALKFAAGLSRNYRSELFIFHMIPVPPVPKYSRTDYKADMDAAKKRLKEFCQGFLDGIDHEYHVWGGALPHLELLKCAEKKDVDLMAMGSHTKKKNGKWYAGSAVERVSFRSDCPVVVVTDPEALLPWKDSLKAGTRPLSDTDRSIHVFSGKEEKP
jgi:nucleotide-binding universal stress UspA family protein